MMGSFGGILFPAFALLHFLLMLAGFFGVAFLLIWAYKALDKKQLKVAAIWLLAIAIVGGILIMGTVWMNAGGFDKDGFAKGNFFGRGGFKSCPIFDDELAPGDKDVPLTTEVVK